MMKNQPETQAQQGANITTYLGLLYINGNIIQKPMPKGRHSRLQGKLCSTINQVAEYDHKISLINCKNTKT